MPMQLIKRGGLTLFSIFLLSAQNQPVDGVLAVVGENLVLHTEVLQQTQMTALQVGIDFNKNPYAFERIYNETLQGLIDQYIVLDAAERDTNIVLTSEEIETALELQMNDLIQRAGSEQALEEALGQSIRHIKKEYWGEVRKMMLIERFRYSLLSSVTITRKEVESFFNTYKDSIPPIQPQYKFSLIELPVEPSEVTKQGVYNQVFEIKNKIVDGDSFEDLAKLHSDDPGSASVGGDLGFMKRGTLVLEYEQTAFSLELGEISEPILSPFGYHIIQLLDRQGERIHTRHILKLLKPSQQDKDAVLDKIRDLYEKAQHDPGLFDSLAVEFKLEHNNSSGVYPLSTEQSIPPIILDNLKRVSPNSISYPFETEHSSVCLAYLYEKTEVKQPTLENSWDQLEEMAKNEKMNREFLTWIDNNRGKTYLKIFGE